MAHKVLNRNGYEVPLTTTNVEYDNTTSGLVGINAQDAIDEIALRKPIFATDIASASAGVFEGQTLCITDTGDEFGNLIEMYIYIGGVWQAYPLPNVLIVTPEDGQTLVKDGGLWKNKYTWEHLATNGKTDGVQHTTTGGYYLTYTYKTKTIYRYITTATDTNGYPVEDSFYATLTGSTLSNLITKRY